MPEQETDTSGGYPKEWDDIDPNVEGSQEHLESLRAAISDLEESNQLTLTALEIKMLGLS